MLSPILSLRMDFHQLFNPSGNCWERYPKIIMDEHNDIAVATHIEIGPSPTTPHHMPQKRKRLTVAGRNDLKRQVQGLYCEGYSLSGIQAKLGIRKDLLERILFNLFRDKTIEPRESSIDIVSASSMIKIIAGELAVEYYEVTRDDSGGLILTPFAEAN